jgi:sporulation protein YlmC with PRC-barrel domain
MKNWRSASKSVDQPLSPLPPRIRLSKALRRLVEFFRRTLWRTQPMINNRRRRSKVYETARGLDEHQRRNMLATEVRSPDGAALGSVDDLALNPETGKLGYLVIARGGFLGFDEARIPIPWEDFKAAPNTSLLVLDTTKSVLDAAPHVNRKSFTVGASSDSDSEKVDAYWKANQPAKTSP